MNLLMLSVDSLRWDMVARTHPDLLATPRFDEATRGFAFTDRCFSVSTATRPVHQSIFSGLYPFEHGITGQHRRERRRGIPRLLHRLVQAGYRVSALSEAAPILGGVDIGAPVQDLPADAASGLDRLTDGLSGTGDRALFVHYWSTHAPYGAADGRALGETAELIRQGAHDVVRERYRQAVISCFEDKIAPLIERLDLGSWAIVLFGDHGERWAVDELYHGRTLHHDVLRVPLFLHVPYRDAQPAGEICSLIDLEPTIRSLLHLGPTQGFGRDLLLACPTDLSTAHDIAGDSGHEPGHPFGGVSGDSGDHPPLYLAQIEPTPVDATDEIHLVRPDGSGLQTQAPDQLWALFNARHKATIFEPEGRVAWSQPLDPTETPTSPSGTFDALEARAQLCNGSEFARGELEDGIQAQALESRLRDLGYLA
ncbi:MAG: sulfatase-like hydrolase/transferase [Gemmatimonadetes bacterium]|jgi:hypothetical protein|nr:sulfatase-like hydrolase/transferase [Gemmatimonadota bacterium]MBT6144956.1 sulfatase-like hydrolase/transferase [Gemmatimonadota bacterium]MBT7859235.1 sulfatase-like hydrolase/transferase [Gemmatimonadota bacterium]